MSAVPLPPTEKRLTYFDGLRGLAAVSVAIFHFTDFFDHGILSGRAADCHWGFEKYIAGTPLNIPFQGGLMVEIFFVLSGYVLVNAFLGNKTFLGAFVRRYIRLALPILAACLTAWLLIQVGLNFAHPLAREIHRSYQHPLHVTFGEAVGQALYTVFVTPNDDLWALDKVLWTIPVEFSGSILIMVLVFVARQQAQWDIPILFFLTIFTWGYHQFFMLCGVWLFFLNEKGQLRFRPRGIIWGGAWLLILLLCASYPPYVPRPGLLYRLIGFDIAPWFNLGFQRFLRLIPIDRADFYHGLGAIFLVWSVLNVPHLKSFFSHFTFLGKISFPLYLIHDPLLFAISGLYFWFKKVGFGEALSVFLTFLIWGIMTFASAWIGYVFVEKPAIQLSRKVGDQIDGFLRQAKPLASP